MRTDHPTSQPIIISGTFEDFEDFTDRTAGFRTFAILDGDAPPHTLLWRGMEPGALGRIKRADITPSEYIKAARLYAFHRALKLADPNRRIFEVAGEWGFWHMGQLGRDYKARFLPRHLPSAASLTNLLSSNQRRVPRSSWRK
jgi:hypothetical protein